MVGGWGNPNPGKSEEIRERKTNIVVKAWTPPDLSWQVVILEPQSSHSEE
jgi:hypothetical protein